MDNARAIFSPFTAEIYASGGQRATVRVCMEDLFSPPHAAQPAHFHEIGCVSCEVAFPHMLKSIYSPEADCGNVSSVTLRGVRSYIDVSDAPTPRALIVHALAESDKTIIRGIYALSAQARPCFVRKFRAEWDALFEAWQERGLLAYILKSEVRAVGYAIVGQSELEIDCARIYEFAALPDSDVTLTDALCALRESGACAARFEIVSPQFYASVT